MCATQSRGFTLVEALITIAISAILLAAAVPMYTDLVVRQRVDAAVNDLSFAVSLTRSEAIKRSSRVAIAPIDAVNWTSGWRVFVDSNDNGLFDPDEQLLREFAAPAEKISIDAKGSGLDKVISYNELGFARQPGGDGLALGHFVVTYDTDKAHPRTLCFSTARVRLVHADKCS